MTRLFLLFFISAIAFSNTAAADIGIDFKSMKRGTKFYYATSAGTQWVKTFKGKRGRFYRIAVRSIPDIRKSRRTEVYNAAGHLVRYEVNSNQEQTITYSPQHCARIVGKCVMSSTNNNVTRVSSTQGVKLITRYAYSTTVNGSKYSSTHTARKLGFSEEASLEVQAAMNRKTGTLGRFNLFTEQHWTESGKTHWSKLVKIEE